MIWLKVKITGKCWESSVYEYGYTDRTSVYTNIIYMDYYVFGVRLMRIPVWSEPVPSFAVMAHGAFGSTNWISDRPYLINAANKKRVIFCRKISIFGMKSA